jgi:hypothetical protein
MRRASSLTNTSLVQAFIAVLFVGILWSAFTLSRYARHPYVLPGSEATSGQVRAKDPYCALDPTCVSIFDKDVLNEPVDANGQIRHWQGMSLVADPQLVYINPLRLLALPNYFLFTTTCGVLVGCAYLIRRSWRMPVIIAVSSWYSLELIRWAYSALKLSSLTHYDVFVLDPQTYVRLAVLISPVVMLFHFDKGLSSIGGRT